MSTIGHPLADLTNLLTPYTTATNPLARAMTHSTASSAAKPGFLPGATPGLPTKAEVIAWYADVAGFDYSTAEVAWGDSFNIFKGAIIMQGIAARYAVRQASSERAMEYGSAMRPFGEVAWSLVEQAMAVSTKADGKSKL